MFCFFVKVTGIGTLPVITLKSPFSLTLSHTNTHTTHKHNITRTHTHVHASRVTSCFPLCQVGVSGGGEALQEGDEDAEKGVQPGAAIHTTAVKDPSKASQASSKVGEFPLAGRLSSKP